MLSISHANHYRLPLHLCSSVRGSQPEIEVRSTMCFCIKWDLVGLAVSGKYKKKELKPYLRWRKCLKLGKNIYSYTELSQKRAFLVSWMKNNYWMNLTVHLLLILAVIFKIETIYTCSWSTWEEEIYDTICAFTSASMKNKPVKFI